MGTKKDTVWNRLGVPVPFMVELFGGLPEWRVARAKTALVIVDMQQYCAMPRAGIWSLAHERGMDDQMSYFYGQLELATAKLSRLLGRARDIGVVVIHVNRDVTVANEAARRRRSVTGMDKDSGLDDAIHQRAFSDDAEPVPALRPRPGEIVVRKNGAGPFGITSIDHVLRELGIELVLVGGVATHQCVEQTIRGASDFGYKAVIIEDGTATVSAELQRGSLLALADWFCKSLTTEQILALIAEEELTL